MFGLLESDVKFIRLVLSKYREIEYAKIFGSRAKGTYKLGSDVDLAIYGEKVDFDTISNLKFELENGPMPYFVDIVDYSHLDHKNLKEHIDRVGKIIYTS